jgi:hypothetical protein
MKRWFFFLLAILLGFGLGLFYTWRVNPRDNTNAELNALRVDYKTDYVLMVAEIYNQDGSLDNAIERLTRLTLAPSDKIVSNAILFAEREGYPPEDLVLMRTLLNGLGGGSRHGGYPAP